MAKRKDKPTPINREKFLNNLHDPYQIPEQVEQPYDNSNPNAKYRKPGEPEFLRANEISMKGDTNNVINITLEDHDEAILYYIKNVIKPTVEINGNQQEVPVIYGSPERWKSMQKDGFFRDKNGKAFIPVIAVKRESFEKDRRLGNKLDGNKVQNVQYFKTGYSKRNGYDNFSVLQNQKPAEEYQVGVIPDYITVTYKLYIFTDYVEHMNSIIEAIEFASDSYWGDKERFNFRASITQFPTPTEVVNGNDRAVKSDLTLTINGYIVPKSINVQKAAPSPKSYNVTKFVFKEFAQESTTSQIDKDGNKVITYTNPSSNNVSYFGTFNGNFIGDLQGTASYSQNSSTASYYEETDPIFQNSEAYLFVSGDKSYLDSIEGRLQKKQNLPTGVLTGLQLSINSDNTKIDINPGAYVISDFTDLENIQVQIIVLNNPITGITPQYLTTGNISYIAIDENQNIIQKSSPFTNEERRTLAILGAAIHSNLSTVNITNEIKAPIVAPTNQLHDLIRAIGSFNLEGNVYGPNGNNLQLDKSFGTVFGLGINAQNYLNPHQLDIVAQTGLTFAYRLQNGFQYPDTNTIIPTHYDLNGVLTPLQNNNKWQIQRINLFQSGLTRIQPGQHQYDSLEEAEAALKIEDFVTETNIATNAVFRSYLIVKKNATDLSDPTQAKFIPVDKFGNVITSNTALTYANIVSALGYIPLDTANFNNFTSSYTTGSFTGSFKGDGSGLTNLPVPVIDTGSLVTTSSFNNFTSSYNQDSASFDSRINNINFDTGSLVTTSSFNEFTSNYNTGSFQGNLNGTSSFAQTASYVDLGYIPENVALKNTGSLTNSTSSYPSDYVVSQSLDYKLNKITTGSIRRVYAVDASNNQEMIDVSDLVVPFDIIKNYPNQILIQAVGNAVNYVGTYAQTITGTQSDLLIGGGGVSYRKILSTTTAGSSINFYDAGIYRITGTKGFYYRARIKNDDPTNIPTSRFSYGLSGTALIGNINPSTYAQALLSFGADNSDSNCQIMYKNNGGVATKINLGNTMPKSSTDEYVIEFWRLEGTTTINYRVTNLTTSAVVQGSFVFAFAGLALGCFRNNDIATTAVSFAVRRVELYIND